MKKKILHIGLSNTMGGIETFILNLMKNINLAHYQIEFLVFHEENPHFYRDITDLGGVIHKITSRRKNYIKNKKELVEFYRKNNDYDVIHYHLVSFSYPDPILYAPKESKVILHSHIAKLDSNLKVKILHKLNKSKFLKRADCLLACAKMTGDFMFNNAKYEVIPNAINFEEYKFNVKTRMKYKRIFNLDEKVVLGHVGRFETQKNHVYLVDMFKRLIDSNNVNYHLLLIGEGSLKPEIEQKVLNLNLEEHVTFLGVRSDVKDLLNAIDLLILPSLYEGLPFVLIESQVNGAKCIVSDQVSNESNINGRIEFLSLDENYINWIECIEKYSQHISVRQNDLMGSCYDIKNAVKTIESFYS